MCGRMKNVSLVVSAVLVLGFSSDLKCGESDEAARALSLVQEKGLGGFAGKIRTDPESIPSHVILSDKSCNQIANPEEKNKAQAWRELGLELLRKILALKDAKLAGSTSLSDVDDLLAIHAWSLEKQGYGNLIIAYVAEGSSATLLLRLLANPKNDINEIRSRSDICIRDTPTADYWLGVLEQEKDTVQLPPEQNNEAEYLKLAKILKYLDNKKSAELGGGEFLFGFGGDYQACYNNYNPAQIGCLLVFPTLRKLSLESCLSLREKLGKMPDNKEDFMQALGKYASPIMKKKDRIGGSIDVYYVLDAWCDALGIPTQAKAEPVINK